MTNLEKIVKKLLKQLPIGGGYVAHVVKVSGPRLQTTIKTQDGSYICGVDVRASLTLMRYYVHDRHSGWYFPCGPKHNSWDSYLDYCGPRLSKEQKERIKKLLAEALSW